MCELPYGEYSLHRVTANTMEGGGLSSLQAQLLNARSASPVHYNSALYSGRMADSYKTAESP